MKLFKSDFSVLLQRERPRCVTSIKCNIQCYISVLEIYELYGHRFYVHVKWVCDLVYFVYVQLYSHSPN